MSLQSFNQNILPLKDKLYRFSLSIVKNGEEAEDIVQDIMLKVWRKRDEWGEWNSMEAMCMTMTRNLSIDRTRARKTKITELPEGYDVVAKGATPDQQASSADMMSHIQKLIDMLPETQKSIIQLREIEGYTYQEIADMLEITLSQVKIGLHRARLFLKEKIVKTTEYGSR